VGDGDERAHLEAAAARLGLLANGVAVFTGRVPYAEITRYYRTIDIFVVPRTNDRVSQLVTPLKPYEAMAMEKAVVVSGVDALLEIVHDGETGRTFRADDPSDLADVIGALMDDPDQRRRLGIAAREWVAANRSWTQNGRLYRELFERLGAA
jgi:glycosyltransferase involved in cell wall biosynthesis